MNWAVSGAFLLFIFIFFLWMVVGTACVQYLSNHQPDWSVPAFLFLWIAVPVCLLAGWVAA